MVDPPDHAQAWQLRLQQAQYVIFDGTALRQRRSEAIYAVMDAIDNQLLFGAYGVHEGAQELRVFYRSLAHIGFMPKSGTIDGNPQQSRYLAAQWPQMIQQRCIVHVQRQGLRWCRRNPKRTDAKHLRTLFLDLTMIKTPHARDAFIQRVIGWDERFGETIRQQRRSSKGWVLSDLALAARMIQRSLPDLFHFIDDPNIARSTNALEGYFGRLKELYRLHRGMSRQNREQYFKWYFYLRPR